MTEWRRRHPPGSVAEVGRWQLDQPSQLQQLRAALREAVATGLAGIDDPDLSDRLLVAATELAGNALRHAQPPVIVALQADGHVIVDVTDRLRQQPPVPDDTRAPGAGGMGLPLVQRLAEDVGWYADPAGKHVWAAFRMRSRVT